MKRLIGRTDMEDALKKLDRLTHEEARMAIAQNLKATHNVDERVRAVADTVVAVDNRVAGVDDRVAGVNVVMQQTANDVDQIKRSSTLNLICAGAVEPYVFLSGKQLRESTHKWLSPPDPSKNHNIACNTHHKKTADWFFQGGIYQEWKSNGSLLWVHGKRSFYPAFLRCPLMAMATL
jgi:hypothetical protein